MRNLKLTALLALSLSLFACSDDDEKDTPKNTASFTTYNVGLAHGYVPNAAERFQPLIDELVTLDTDVLCLQEVWMTQDADGAWIEDQVTSFATGLAPAFPNNYYEITRAEEGAFGCSAEEVVPLEACYMTNCVGVEPGDLAGCITANCGAEFGGVSTECSQCLVAELGGTFEEIRDACVGGTNSGIAYGGSNGLMLFSKHPLTNTKLTEFSAVQNARALLEADMEHPEFGTVRIYCTHLTSDLSGQAAYPADISEFATYEEEQAAQIDAIVASVTAGGVDAVILGDMNTGVAGDGYSAELPQNYQKFLDAGWTSPYGDSAGAACTYCTDNTLTGDNNGNTDDNTNDKLIDHIFPSFTGTVTTEGAERIYDETVDIGGEQLHLSDHYGVTVVLGK